MKIQVISDVHAEFHRDGGFSFINSLDTKEAIIKEGMSNDALTAKVLVIAGDLAPIAIYEEIIPSFLEKYSHVVAILGNHEFYLSDRPTVMAEVARLAKLYPKFHILEDSTVTIEGQRFIGSTLWFPDTEQSRPHRRNMNDFNVIKGFEDWVFYVNEHSMDYLRRNVKPTDVVITHHVPTIQGTGQRWWGSPLQPFFVCNMESLLVRQHPKVWVFGHTHDSYDALYGSPGKKRTHLVCNPFGYAGREENPQFRFKFDVTVPI